MTENLTEFLVIILMVKNNVHVLYYTHCEHVHVVQLLYVVVNDNAHIIHGLLECIILQQVCSKKNMHPCRSLREGFDCV